MTIILSGCVFETMDKALPMLKGQPVETAFSYLGLPDEELKVAGKKVYRWRMENSGTAVIPMNHPISMNAYGSGGWASVYGSTTSYVPINYRDFCQIDAVTENNVILDIHYKGNEDGCSPYADALQPLAAKSRQIKKENKEESTQNQKLTTTKPEKPKRGG